MCKVAQGTFKGPKSCAKGAQACTWGPKHVKWGPKHEHFVLIPAMHVRYHDDNFKMSPSYSVFGLTFVKMISTSVDVKFLSISLRSLVILANFAPSRVAGPCPVPLSDPNAQKDLNRSSIILIYSKKNTNHQYIR